MQTLEVVEDELLTEKLTQLRGTLLRLFVIVPQTMKLTCRTYPDILQIFRCDFGWAQIPFCHRMLSQNIGSTCGLGANKAYESICPKPLLSEECKALRSDIVDIDQATHIEFETGIS